MATFFARRYMRRPEGVGIVERSLGAIIVLLLAGVVTVYVRQVITDKGYLFEVEEAAYRDPQEQAASPNPFPDPVVTDWCVPREVSRFTPENLYQKINGRADTYLQFHVVGLTFGTYYHRTAPDGLIDVYWYDMGRPVNAFGIYRSEASPEAAAVPIGNDAYATGGAVFFWKGTSYVQVLPTRFDESDARVSLAIAERLATAIEDTGEDMWALSVLPQSGRIAGSFSYIAKDAFSLDFLSEVFTADYEVDGKRITLFIHRAADEASAAALLDRYVLFFEEYGKVIWTEPDASRRIVAGDVSGMIDVVFAKGRYLGGATGAKDAAVGRKAATTFYDELVAQ
jgi:hypothetical protein